MPAKQKPAAARGSRARGLRLPRPGPPKTKHGRREVRLPDSLAMKLRAYLAGRPDQDSTAILFPNDSGSPPDPTNLRPRVLKPLVRQAGAPWAGFHTFRHTFASLHLGRGTNLLQLSRALGHHSPAFTLTRYTHLLPGGGGTGARSLTCITTSVLSPVIRGWASSRALPTVAQHVWLLRTLGR